VSANSLKLKNPIALAIGFFIVFILVSACESEKTPAQVTKIFWQAMAENNLSLAKNIVLLLRVSFWIIKLHPSSK